MHGQADRRGTRSSLQLGGGGEEGGQGRASSEPPRERSWSVVSTASSRGNWRKAPAVISIKAGSYFLTKQFG